VGGGKAPMWGIVPIKYNIAKNTQIINAANKSPVPVSMFRVYLIKENIPFVKLL
jgi:hypothetical protein